MEFCSFATTYAADFLTYADSTQVAWGLVNLKTRSGPWPSDWGAILLQGSGLQLDTPDLLRLCVAYELYSDSTLQCRDARFFWDPAPEASALKVLRAELEALKLSQREHLPPTEDWLCANPSSEGARRFESLPGHTQWQKDMLAIFTSAFADVSEDRTTYINDLWKALVQAYFRGRSYSTSSVHTRDPPNSQATSSRSSAKIHPPAPFTLDDVVRRGGTVSEERTCRGLTKFAFLEGRKYYVAREGNLWDTQFPPPKACFRCHVPHWHWDCPLERHPA